MKLTKGRLMTLIHKKNQTSKRYKKKSSRRKPSKMRTLRKRKHFNLHRATLKKYRGGQPSKEGEKEGNEEGNKEGSSQKTTSIVNDSGATIEGEPEVPSQQQVEEERPNGERISEEPKEEAVRLPEVDSEESKGVEDQQGVVESEESKQEDGIVPGVDSTTPKEENMEED